MWKASAKLFLLVASFLKAQCVRAEQASSCLQAADETELATDQGVTSLLQTHIEFKSLLSKAASEVVLKKHRSCEKLAQSRYAFVTLAFDVPGLPASQSTLWPVVAMARSVQRLSDYPVVVFTNTTALSDGTDVATAFCNLNVIVKPVEPVPIPDSLFSQSKQFDAKRDITLRVSMLRFQAWRLTQFDKLIWVDSDIVFFRGMDWLFSMPGMWAQDTDFYCEMVSKTGGSGSLPCGGFFSFKPSEDFYHSILECAQTFGPLICDDWSGCQNDHDLLRECYRNVHNQSFGILNQSIVTFGQCLPKVAASMGKKESRKEESLNWSSATDINPAKFSAVVHKSDENNTCFQLENSLTENCKEQTEGRYWRTAFCEGVALLGTQAAELKGVC